MPLAPVTSSWAFATVPMVKLPSFDIARMQSIVMPLVEKVISPYMTTACAADMVCAPAVFCAAGILNMKNFAPPIEKESTHIVMMLVPCPWASGK